MNKKQLLDHINSNIDEVNDYFKDYTATYDEVMDWELQDTDNAIFDAGYMSALIHLKSLISKLN